MFLRYATDLGEGGASLLTVGRGETQSQLAIFPHMEWNVYSLVEAVIVDSLSWETQVKLSDSSVTLWEIPGFLVFSVSVVLTHSNAATLTL